MKRALVITAALLFPLLAFGPAQAQEAKKAPPKKAPAKAAAPAAADDAQATPAKKAPPKKAAPVAKEGEDKAAAPADKKAADPKAAAKDKAKAKAKGESEMCEHCKTKLEHMKSMAATHKAIADSYKKDPVPKLLKGKNKTIYTKHAKAQQKFHADLAKVFDKQAKAMEKLHKGKAPKLCDVKDEFPEEAKAAMMERGKANLAQMKQMAEEMNAMVAEAEAKHSK